MNSFLYKLKSNFFEGEYDWEVVRLVGIVYFLQGCLGIVGIALPLFLRELGYSIKAVAYFTALMTIPWFLKILYGVISDTFPIFGMRRKPYLILYSVLASVGWFALAIVPQSWGFLLAAVIVAQLGFAATDVITDGIVVEHSTKETTQTYQSIAWGARSVGALITGIVGGYLAATIPYRLIFAVMGVLPLVALMVVVAYHEKSVEESPFKNMLEPIIRSFQILFRGDLGIFCVIVLIAATSSVFVTPLFFFMREQLGFDEKFLGLLSSTTWLGAIIGCGFYLKCLKTIKLKSALMLAFAIGVFNTLLCLFIIDRVSALSIYFLGGVLGYISLLPIMSTAARLSNGTGVEGSLFAILMSLNNIGVAGSGALGGWLSERVSLQVLIIGSAAITLLGFTVIRRLKTVE